MTIRTPDPTIRDAMIVARRARFARPVLDKPRFVWRLFAAGYESVQVNLKKK